MTSSSDTFPFGIADVVELLGLTARRAAAIAAPDVFVCVDVEPPAQIPAKGAV